MHINRIPPKITSTVQPQQRRRPAPGQTRQWASASTTELRCRASLRSRTECRRPGTRRYYVVG